MYNNGVSIQEVAGKFKRFFSNTEYLLTVLIVTVSLVSFWLGRLSTGPMSGPGQNIADIAAPAAVSLSLGEHATSSNQTGENPGGGYVASRNGTKYHLPWCSGAQQISEKNKIFFATKQEAEAAGYTPASNCKDI